MSTQRADHLQRLADVVAGGGHKGECDSDPWCMHYFNVHVLASAAGQRFGSPSCWSRPFPDRSVGVASAQWQKVQQPASSHASIQADTDELLRTHQSSARLHNKEALLADCSSQAVYRGRRVCGWQAGLQVAKACAPRSMPLYLRGILSDCRSTAQSLTALSGFQLGARAVACTPQSAPAPAKLLERRHNSLLRPASVIAFEGHTGCAAEPVRAMQTLWARADGR